MDEKLMMRCSCRSADDASTAAAALVWILGEKRTLIHHSVRIGRQGAVGATGLLLRVIGAVGTAVALVGCDRLAVRMHGWRRVGLRMRLRLRRGLRRRCTQQRLRRGRFRLAHTVGAIGTIHSASTSHWLEAGAAAHRRLEANEALVAHAVALGRARVHQLHFVG